MSSAAKRQVFLTLDAVAFTLGVPRDWLRREAIAGRVPSLDIGNRRLFNTEAVAEALLKRCGHVPEDEGTCGEVQEIEFGDGPGVHVSKIHPPVPDPDFPGRVIRRIDFEDDEHNP